VFTALCAGFKDKQEECRNRIFDPLFSSQNVKIVNKEGKPHKKKARHSHVFIVVIGILVLNISCLCAVRYFDKRR
jgi:hypothetical protein